MGLSQQILLAVQGVLASMQEARQEDRNFKVILYSMMR